MKINPSNLNNVETWSCLSEDLEWDWLPVPLTWLQKRVTLVSFLPVSYTKYKVPHAGVFTQSPIEPLVIVEELSCHVYDEGLFFMQTTMSELSQNQRPVWTCLRWVHGVAELPQVVSVWCLGFCSLTIRWRCFYLVFSGSHLIFRYFRVIILYKN